MPKYCTCCGAPLKDIEIRYYRHNCEDCEQMSLQRVNAWLHGANDNELDEIFTGLPACAHSLH